MRTILRHKEVIAIAAVSRPGMSLMTTPASFDKCQSSATRNTSHSIAAPSFCELTRTSCRPTRSGRNVRPPSTDARDAAEWLALAVIQGVSETDELADPCDCLRRRLGLEPVA